MASSRAGARSTVDEYFPTLSDDVSSFLVREGEGPWTREEIVETVEVLLEERDRLTEEIAAADADLAEFLRNSGDGSGDDQADYGSSALEREQELTFLNNSRDMLEQTKLSLQRISSGVYGTCESCGNAIGKARQMAFPRASLCVTCKQREERR